jgi:hypothetical protein
MCFSSTSELLCCDSKRSVKQTPSYLRGTPTFITSLTKQQLVVINAIRQTKIPTFLDSWFTNTPSVKILGPQTNYLPYIFLKNNQTCWSIKNLASFFSLFHVLLTVHLDISV